MTLTSDEFERRARNTEIAKERINVARLVIVHGYPIPDAMNALKMPWGADRPKECPVYAAMRRVVARIRDGKPRQWPKRKVRTIPDGWRSVTIHYPPEMATEIRRLKLALQRKERAAMK